MNYIPYVITLFIPLLLLVLEEIGIENNKLKFCKKYIWVLFLLLAGLRGNGSGDYFNYLNGVEPIDSFSKIFIIDNYPFEIGFRAIAYINNLLRITPQFTMFVLSTISILNINYLINKYSSNIYLSWILYFPFLLIFDMHHTRSALAIVFSMRFFFSLIVSKEGAKSIVFAVLSLMFHKSGILPLSIITVYYFYIKKFNPSEDIRKKLLIVLFFSVVLVSIISPTNLIQWCYSVFPNNNLIKKLNNYLMNPQWSYPYKLYDPRFILLIITYISIGLKSKMFDKNLRKYSDMIFIAIMIVVFLSDSTMLTMRFYNFFNVFTVFYIPLYFSKLDDSKSSIMIKTSLFGVYLLYFTALVFIQVPYYFFFL